MMSRPKLKPIPAQRPDLDRMLKDRIDELSLHLLGEPTYRNAHEWRYGRKGSLKIEIDGPGQGQWYSFEDQQGGGPLQLIAYVQTQDASGARRWACDWLGVRGGAGSTFRTSRKKSAKPARLSNEDVRRKRASDLITASLPISNTLGETYLHNRGVKATEWPDNVRFHPGGPNPDNWTDLPALLLPMTDAQGNQTAVHRVFLSPEGQKADVRLQKRSDGIVKGSAVLFPARSDNRDLILTEGVETALSLWWAKGCETWAMAGAFREIKVPLDRRIIFAADDDPKVKSAHQQLERVLNATRKTGADVWLATPYEEAREKRQDFNDVLCEEGREAVRARIDAAQRWIADIETEVAILARMSDLRYDQIREAKAKEIRVRLSTLDEAVKAHKKGADEPQGARPLTFDEPEPWPEPVSLSSLLDELTVFFSRHVSLPEHGAIACALWTLHTYAFKACHDTPRLAITSPEMRCGKTTLLDAVHRLSAKSIMASNITSAAMFRTIEKHRPTLFVDEADTFLKGNNELRGIINSGHSSTGSVIRSVGDEHEPTSFSTFAAVAIATIGKLPGTILDRSVEIKMKRKKKEESVTRLRNAVGVDELRQRCARFAADQIEVLKDSEPNLPEELGDRAADNWQPLLAIADIAGGSWPQRAREAALVLSMEPESGDNLSIRTQLLADIRAIFDAQQGDRIGSVDLCTTLAEKEDRPWPELQRGNPITTRQLARLLQPFNIKPGTKRQGTETFKGYVRKDFEDAFERYLSPDPSQRHNPQIPSPKDQFQSVTDIPNVADQKLKKPAETLGCDGVTDETRLDGDGAMPWEATV